MFTVNYLLTKFFPQKSWIFFIIFQIDDSTIGKLSKMENNHIKTIYLMNEIFTANLLKISLTMEVIPVIKKLTFNFPTGSKVVYNIHELSSDF